MSDNRAHRYDGLSRDALVARLTVAEDALVLIGWSSTTLGEVDSEGGKAAEQAWQQWCGMVGGTDFCDPKRHTYLDGLIPQLAATRDRIRRETLERFFGPGAAECA